MYCEVFLSEVACGFYGCMMYTVFVHHRPALVGSSSGGLSLPHYVTLDIFNVSRETKPAVFKVVDEVKEFKFLIIFNRGWKNLGRFCYGVVTF